MRRLRTIAFWLLAGSVHAGLLYTNSGYTVAEAERLRPTIERALSLARTGQVAVLLAAGFLLVIAALRAGAGARRLVVAFAGATFCAGAAFIGVMLHGFLLAAAAGGFRSEEMGFSIFGAMLLVSWLGAIAASPVGAALLDSGRPLQHNALWTGHVAGAVASAASLALSAPGLPHGRSYVALLVATLVAGSLAGYFWAKPEPKSAPTVR